MDKKVLFSTDGYLWQEMNECQAVLKPEPFVIDIEKERSGSLLLEQVGHPSQFIASNTGIVLKVSK